VARPRRLRHKLMLGLALVVGSVILLLAGTLYGINSYQTTVRTTERKLEELQLVNILIETLKGPARATGADAASEYRELRDQAESARFQLGYYRKFHAETVDRGLDPDAGDMEVGLLKQLETHLAQFEAAVDAARGTQVNFQGEDPGHRAAVKGTYEDTRKVVESLRQALIDDVAKSIRASNSSIRQSTWIVGGAAAWAVVLVLAMLYYFRRWIFAPIRELWAGVQRVHGGTFDQPIRLDSRDELQELADEFNAMAARVRATVADLARQVNERSRQLVRSERMVSVGFLAAGVAHEINNPLASILFCAEALERRLEEVLAVAVAGRGAAPGDAEVLTRYLKMIQQEALRCKDITQKLLDFSRTGERKREPADLAGLVRGVLEVARHLPNCRGKQIAFDPTAYVVAPVNAQDLKSVILNLVVNALDSMDDGGTLSIRLSTNNTYAEMAFTDTGCGMTPDVLRNIFEPFFTRSRTGKGTGLGLFISHQIIDQHGGTIEASSPGPGQGSTFTVRIPLREIDRGQLPFGGPPADDAVPATDPADGTVLPFPGRKAA
jgi:two-component system NtrC family sensor kinase